MYDNFVINSVAFTLNSLLSLNFLSLLLGILISYFIYYKRKFLNITIFENTSKIYLILSSEYGFKKLSDTYIPNLFKKIAIIMWKTYDELLIDKIIVNGVANKIQQISLTIRRFRLALSIIMLL